jgi:transcriptional regulator with XRE-family HTH domain
MSGFGQRRVARAFGKVLRAVRHEAGVSQELLAERADIDRTYPSLIERGLRQPTIGIFIEIAVALRMEPATLITMTMARLRGDPP